MTTRFPKDLKGITRSEIVVPISTAPSQPPFELRFAAIVEALIEIEEKIEIGDRKLKLNWFSPKSPEGGLFVISVRAPNGHIFRVLEFWALGDRLVAMSPDFIEKQSGKCEWKIDDYSDLIQRLRAFLDA